MNENTNPATTAAATAITTGIDTGLAAAQEQNTTQTTDTQDTQDTQNQQEAANTGEQREERAQRTFTQADVDRMIAQRVARERRDIERQLDNARQEGRTEAERLAQMTEEQRVQHEREQAQQEAQRREDQLRQREADITRRELRAQAIDTLASRGLPTGLNAVLDYSSADACNASIDTLEKEWRAAVQNGVDARLKASGVNLPSPGGQPDYAKMSDAEYYAAMLNRK